MAPHTQADRSVVIGTGFGKGISEDARQHSAINSDAEARAVRLQAAELATNLIWLPGTTSSDTFTKRCEKLAEDFDAIFENVETAYAQAPKSEGLLWLRDNAQQLSAVTRQLATELGPLTNLPHVSSKGEVVPRVLAIARAYLDEADDSFSKINFTAFCLAFEETTALAFHEIGALVPAVKLVVLEEIAARGSTLINDPIKIQRARPRSASPHPSEPYGTSRKRRGRKSWRRSFLSTRFFATILSVRMPRWISRAVTSIAKAWQRLRIAAIDLSWKWQKKRLRWPGRHAGRNTTIHA